MGVARLDIGKTQQSFAEVRSLTRELVAPLSAEDLMVQSMPDASPAKWHLAHTTWFFETFILLPNLRGYRAFDPRFTFLFNSYYKQLGGHPSRAQRGLWSRPSLDDVLAYRRHVDEAMAALLHAPVAPEIEAAVILGLNHEQQHQELILTDIKHALWSNPIRPPYQEEQEWRRPPVGDSANAERRRPAGSDWLSFPGGIHSIGHSGAGFAFDNESPRHEVLLRPFRLSNRLVTNAEFLAFMDDGGYRRPELWLSEGWDQLCTHSWTAPLYWEKHDDRWRVFTLAGMLDVDPDEPVCHISYYEADAYARWAGARLPLESEWEIAAADLPIQGNLLEERRFHPAEATGSGLQQMFGDCWEWTASPYVAYPGYRPAEGALGEYNGKFMCNQWVLRGGSCVTPRTHIRPSYRNFFPAHARWQFSSLRLAADGA